MLKKHLSTVLAIVLAVSTFTSCSTAPASVAAPSSADTVSSETASSSVSLGGSYTLATGGTSGTFYPYGAALCQVVNSKIGTNITANSTGGGKENVAQLKNEETDFALLDADMMAYAPVSYTHLDVYKRQGLAWWGAGLFQVSVLSCAVVFLLERFLQI